VWLRGWVGEEEQGVRACIRLLAAVGDVASRDLEDLEVGQRKKRGDHIVVPEVVLVSNGAHMQA
jgi:hypothetical protein